MPAVQYTSPTTMQNVYLDARHLTGGLRFEIMGSGGQSTNTRRSGAGKPGLKKPTNRAPWSKHRSKKRR